jgi:hypothetical protein
MSGIGELSHVTIPAANNTPRFPIMSLREQIQNECIGQHVQGIGKQRRGSADQPGRELRHEHAGIYQQNDNQDAPLMPVSMRQVDPTFVTTAGHTNVRSFLITPPENIQYSAGNTNNVNGVDENSPSTTTLASGHCTSEPTPSSVSNVVSSSCASQPARSSQWHCMQ